MASTKEIRRRIKSIKNTGQITKALQMVSATKMRRAQSQATLARPYRDTLSLVVTLSSGKIDPSLHPLLSPGLSDKMGVVLLSTDKGMCGSLNANIFRMIQNEKILAEARKTDEWEFYTVGRKGREFIARTGRKLAADFESTEKVSFTEAAKVRKFIVNAFLHGEVGTVYLAYADFVSTLRQEARLVKLLPVDPVVLHEALAQHEATDDMASEFLFEPNLDTVLDFALVHLIDTQIYQAMLEMKASEHSARMIAMQNATNNAKDLVSDLTLTYNQMRQDAITRELLEIASAAAALE